jgi:hypothetical protein
MKWSPDTLYTGHEEPEEIGPGENRLIRNQDMELIEKWTTVHGGTQVNRIDVT